MGAGCEKSEFMEHSLCGKTGLGNSFEKRQFVGQMGTWDVPKRGDWWNYTPKNDTSWCWEKLLKVKERFRTYLKSEHTVKQGHQWLTQTSSYPNWANLVWNRVSIPRHSLTAWLFMHQKLPVLHRIGRFTHLSSTKCGLCQQSTET